jgi:hypothetical protein
MTEFLETLRAAHENRSARNFPDINDSRLNFGLLFPSFKPKFEISFSGCMIFTMGSCFARNIEEVLIPRGVDLPTMAFSVPKTEWPARSNGLLNEYNPGTMCQRILFALRQKDYPPETIVPVGELYTDLLLPGGSPVTFERAIARRNEITSVYEKLPRSELLIITLGLTEAWFDNDTKLYLNQMPPHAFAARHKGRFEFRRLDVFDCMPMLEEALDAVTKAGPKVLLTVSPVPLPTTFSGMDCVVANEFSKSVLRVAAERLATRPTIDYFPSYEIVRSGGLASYIDDCIHVKNEVVERVTGFMLDAYAGARP